MATDPWQRDIPPLPTSLAIDRLANAMVSQLGMIWAKMDVEARSQFRVMASAALVATAVEAYPALVLLTQEIEAGAAAFRAAVKFVDREDGPNDIAQGLTLAAATLEKIHAALHPAPEEPDDDAGEPI